MSLNYFYVHGETFDSNMFYFTMIILISGIPVRPYLTLFSGYFKKNSGYFNQNSGYLKKNSGYFNQNSGYLMKNSGYFKQIF